MRASGHVSDYLSRLEITYLKTEGGCLLEVTRNITGVGCCDSGNDIAIDRSVG